MASYRNISMSFWTDTKVVDTFTPEDKYVYLYCMTNPHTNLCGCYEISIKQMAQETGYNEDAVKQIIKRLDKERQVIRYSLRTKELLILNWFRYNWSKSEKLNPPLLAEIRNVKNDRFREYLADRYNERENVKVPYETFSDLAPADPDQPSPTDDERGQPASDVPPEKKVKHKHGEYGWVRLTDEEYARLLQELGADELRRCIAYVDEFAQTNGNKSKWKDWNLVIRKCHRDKWGIPRNGPSNTSANSAMDDLRQLHDMFGEEEGK